MCEPRVLSIQSHVVHGYCGNRSAVFPLQLLGFEVDFINSVQFSNHTGYPYWKGQVLNSDELEELVQGLKLNNLHVYSHLLTGYIGSESFLHKIVDVIKELKSKNPNLIYVCDPVLGDEGKFYVPEKLLPIYIENILPLADIITPNQFELEMLSGISVNSLSDLTSAIKILHERGPKVVVISSSNITETGFCKNSLTAYSSSFSAEKKCTIFKLSMPYYPARFIGTGDLFAALFLAWMERSKADIKLSLDNSVNTIQCVLKKTLELLKDDSRSPADLELKLIQSKEYIECPPSVLHSIQTN